MAWGWPSPEIADHLCWAQSHFRVGLPMAWGWPTPKYCRWHPIGPESSQSSYAKGVELAHHQMLPITSGLPGVFLSNAKPIQGHPQHLFWAIERSSAAGRQEAVFSKW